MKLHINYSLLLLALSVAGMAAIADDGRKSKVAANDAEYLSFGRILEASGKESPDWKNPHLVTAYAIGMC